MKEIFLVKLGGRLYIENSLYSLFPTTTKEKINAKIFTDEFQAEKMAKKSGGTVEKYYVLDEVEYEHLNLLDQSAVEELRNQIKQCYQEVAQLKNNDS